ncbi:glycolate oxidase FAD binding subunit [Tepidimonas ignava]|uniref:GlcD: glycolate oxidase, subunit GlcD n=1 Tax=Tepidimonas ignava TaxID=114249 RepID=A0A4R3LFA1_9BURK|nr:glycolate oxidase subunit GlcE [Tepidimonas ignava]TCS96136.1 glycolate oxidase FAD binding subunit [Tepidimonas ignava]TSE21156.1 glcD: glycolate oxidase, subunit GlcD [Tepidimonas ignava]
MVEPAPPSPQAAADVVAQWAHTIRTTAAQGGRLAIRGGGSKAFYGEPLGGELPVLDTRALSGVVLYEPTELVVRAFGGTPLAALESLLHAHGQCLPFEPPHFGPEATVGGMVAAGLAGPARMAAGGVRDYVLGVRLLNGRGEDLYFGGEVMKNVAGYDVSRALAGSLGALGVIVEVALKVLPRAAGECTLRLPLPLPEALHRLACWRAQPRPLNANAWLPDDGGVLWLRLRGAQAAVDAARQQLLAELPGGASADPDEAQALWQGLREHTHRWLATPPSPAHGLWRLVVPPTTPAWPSWPNTLVEWMGAQRWVWAPLADGADLRALAQQAGGHATLFRPPAQTPDAAPRFSAPEAALAALQQRVRAAFDPQQVFAHRLRLA